MDPRHTPSFSSPTSPVPDSRRPSRIRFNDSYSPSPAPLPLTSPTEEEADQDRYNYVPPRPVPHAVLNTHQHISVPRRHSSAATMGYYDTTTTGPTSRHSSSFSVSTGRGGEQVPNFGMQQGNGPPPANTTTNDNSYSSFNPFQQSSETLVNEDRRRPSLGQRSLTEEHLRHRATREAEAIVASHAGEQPPFGAQDYPQQQQQRRDTTYSTDSWDPEGNRAAAGILSNLLRLYGQQQGIGADVGGDGGVGGEIKRGETTSSEGYDNKSSSCRKPRDEEAYQHIPRVSLKSTQAATSTVKSVHSTEEDDLDEEERAAQAKKEQKAKLRADEMAALDAMELKDTINAKMAALKKGKFRKQRHRQTITDHVADIIQRQNFILKLAKALMSFGAPSHRLESQLNATAQVLEVNAQFIHVPSVVIASFGDPDTHTPETKFVKASGGLNLGMLHAIHGVYRDVIHDEISVEDGSIALEKMLKAKPIYNLWQRMLIAAMCAGIIAPLGFGGSIVDAAVSGAFGATLAFLQLYAARKNAIFSNIFEISIAALISFVSRGLSTTDYFCYESLSSAGVVLVLPGYVILCGSLELASKNIIAGSVRMVYAIIYTLFLGFSISIGSDFFYLFDPSARRQHVAESTVSTYTIDGTFKAASQSFAGSFTFTNQTSAVIDATKASLQKGNVMCYRDPSWEWWRQSASVYWLILLVPAFSLFLSLWNLQPIRSRELPVMLFIACIGFITNRLATEYIFDRSDVVSFIGATVIGLLGNMYSRLFNGTAFTAMATGVLFLVPSGIAAAGGLAMTSGSGDSYNSGLMIGFRMVQVAIGITIGLFFASFLVYSVGTKKKGGALGFAF